MNEPVGTVTSDPLVLLLWRPKVKDHCRQLKDSFRRIAKVLCNVFRISAYLGCMLSAASAWRSEWSLAMFSHLDSSPLQVLASTWALTVDRELCSWLKTFWQSSCSLIKPCLHSLALAAAEKSDACGV